MYPHSYPVRTQHPPVPYHDLRHTRSTTSPLPLCRVDDPVSSTVRRMRRFILRAPCSPLVEGERLGTSGAHEHGIARLGLAVDGTRLTVDLALPAESVFGFERAPRSAEERATAAEALDRLRAGGARLIAFPAGVTCTLDSAEVERLTRMRTTSIKTRANSTKTCTSSPPSPVPVSPSDRRACGSRTSCPAWCRWT